MAHARRSLSAAANAASPREYFFYIGTSGNIYHLRHNDTISTPSGPTHARDIKFIDTFTKALQPRPGSSVYRSLLSNKVFTGKELRMREYLEKVAPVPGKYDAFPWISPCLGELNYVRSADPVTPIVFRQFHHMDGNANEKYSETINRGGKDLRSRDEDSTQLIYAGTLRTPFTPEKMFVHSGTGNIYHPSPVCGWGTFRTAIAMELGDSLHPIVGENTWKFSWRGRTILLPELAEVPLASS